MHLNLLIVVMIICDLIGVKLYTVLLNNFDTIFK